MRYRILPYRQGSRGAKALADALGGRVLKLEGSSFVPKTNDVIINWGNTNTPEFVYPPGPLFIFNSPSVVRDASNKLLFFKKMHNLEPGLTPDFWTTKEDIPDDAFPVVCRTVLAGHSGDGIVIADTRDAVVDAPLYVRYEKKQDEYRIHVASKDPEVYDVIAVQRKARRLETPDSEVNWKVRNLAGGFVFVRQGVTPPPAVIEAGRNCLRASGLDFGAVDVIWNASKEKAYVLEINTAPGLEGQTVEDYANFFRNLGNP